MFAPRCLRRLKKELDAVVLSEDEPVVTVEMIERFVEAFVVVGFANLDRGANNHFRAVSFRAPCQTRSPATPRA